MIFIAKTLLFSVHSNFKKNHPSLFLIGEDERKHNSLAFFQRGTPFQAIFPLRDFWPPEIWSENNRKISITIEICITVDSPRKQFLEESQQCYCHIKRAVFIRVPNFPFQNKVCGIKRQALTIGLKSVTNSSQKPLSRSCVLE